MFASAKAPRVRRGTSIRPAFRPTMDTFEARQLLTVAPFLQGTVFNDSNGNGQLDTNETPLAGATIDLFAANSTTKLASVTSGTDGGYVFDASNVNGGLTVGATYNLVESASGYTSTGAQALSTLNPASVLDPNMIQVTVVDPNTVAATFTSPATYGKPPFDGISLTLAGAPATPNPTQLNFTLSGDPNLSGASFTTLCVGLRDLLSYNTPFSTAVVPQSALPNGGQIGYLYNHYGLTTLSSTSPVPSSIQGIAPKNLAAGLQLAVWQLEYGSSLVLTGYDSNYTSAQDYADLQTAAAAFLSDSTGKSEKIAVLDASLTGKLPTPTATYGGQSVLAALSYNFGTKLTPITPGSLSGFVYADSNNNGVRDSGEQGIGSVPITLTNLVNGKAVTVGTATTNADGSYLFGNLAPGTYTVVEGVVTGYLPSSTNTGSILGVTVVEGGINANNNFGEVLFKPGTIAGVVFADKTGDGFSGDDAPLSGVTVQLLNSTGTVVATRKVGSDGAYSFTNLAPGTYTVQEVVPSGYVQTAPGSLVYTVPIVSGQTARDNNFDNYLVDGCCPISNICYTDITGDGIKSFNDLRGNTNQGDQVTARFYVGGKATVTVSFVTYTATSNFDLTKQSIFDVDTKTFTPGWHTLSVTIPNSYYQIDLVCGGAISRFIPASGATYHGEGRFIDADNGGSEVVPAAFSSLSGSVFADSDYDGFFDAKENGLGGVTVKLTGKDVNGKSVSLTRITNKDGSYSFNGLQAGTYKVSEVTPDGFFTTRNSVGTVAGQVVGSLGGDNISGITLSGGKDGVSYNFGEQAFGNKLGCNQTASWNFWKGCSGQSLIKSLNGGSGSTRLGDWLAAELPNSFSCLAGKSNAYVASYCQSLGNWWGLSSRADTLATALSCYASNSNLAGGTYGSCYGFKVTCDGAGASTIDCGSGLSCWGGPSGKISLIQFLQYADSTVGTCNFWLSYKLANLFDYVNGCGIC